MLAGPIGRGSHRPHSFRHEIRLAVAANWLRAAVEAIVDNTLAHDGSLPTANIGDFLLDTRQSPQAGRLAFELIAQTDPNAPPPSWLSSVSPATELKYDAVERSSIKGSP